MKDSEGILCHTKVVYSPYRICPLGAHIDHQKGVVTGMALNRGVVFEYIVREDDFVSIESHEFDGRIEFHLSNIPPMEPSSWGNYVRGAAIALKQKSSLKFGFNGFIKGSFPVGGISSSAAVSSAYLMAFADANHLDIPKVEYIQLTKYIENKYIGLNNGILDQSVNLLSQRDHLLYLDTNTGEYSLTKLSEKMKPFLVMVAYSGVKKALVNTNYNTRVAECKEAASKLIRLETPSVELSKETTLRDVDESVFQQYGNRLPLNLYKRAKHFYDEQNRVRYGLSAWKNGDLEAFGKLMFQSGESSIHYYESGSDELIRLYEIIKKTPGVYGSRFSGAGYRGSCIALIDPNFQESIRAEVTKRYAEVQPNYASEFQIDFCETDDGARFL
jgi:galactokinase